MADSANNERSVLNAPTHSLVEVPTPPKGKVLSSSGTSANLTRNTRVVSDRIIFVDNIADSISQQEFVEMMSEYAVRGPIVDIKFLTRTKGSSFSFVEFSNEPDGKAAILALNKKDFTTNSGKVLELRASKAENPTETVSNKNLYVKGLPRHWSNDDLKRRFRGYGSISHCRTLKRPGSSNENTGVGFVHFFNSLDAAKAIEEVDDHPADPSDPQSNLLEVKFARAKKPRQRRQTKRGGGNRGRGVVNDYNRTHMGPQWNNFGRGTGMRGGGMPGGGRGRNMRGGPVRGGYGGMPNADSLMMNSPDASYPPNEGNDTQVWAKMVEIMQNMGGLLTTPQTNQPTRSMWQNPYNMYGGSMGGNYQNYGGYPRNNNGDSALARVVSDTPQWGSPAKSHTHFTHPSGFPPSNEGHPQPLDLTPQRQNHMIPDFDSIVMSDLINKTTANYIHNLHNLNASDQRSVVMSDMLDHSTSNYIASNFNSNFNAFGDSSHTTPI